MPWGRNILVLSVCLLMTGFTAFAQKEEVIQVLKQGNAEKLAQYFDATVDIALPGKNNNYSKRQAEMVIKDFFQLHKVNGFELQHSGGNAGSVFFIGTLLTGQGKMRTTVHMRQRGDKLLIQSLAFDPLH